MYGKEKWYRVTVLGRPVGPWRRCRNKARRDAIEHELGGYDEWGTFFMTVPGEMETKSVWAGEAVS